MILAGVFGGAAFIAYQLVLHRIVSSDPHSLVAELLVAAPLLLFVAWLVGRTRLGPVAGAATLALGAAGCIAWNRAGTDALLPVLPHLVIYFMLLAWFGASLLPGREPLVTYMARHVHESLSAELLAYTRRVTTAWCVFFITMGATSLVLFVWTPTQTWSLFANLLNLPLVIAMFLGEYAWRRLRHPDMSRATVPTMIRAFMKIGAAGNESSRG